MEKSFPALIQNENVSYLPKPNSFIFFSFKVVLIGKHEGKRPLITLSFKRLCLRKTLSLLFCLQLIYPIHLFY